MKPALYLVPAALGGAAMDALTAPSAAIVRTLRDFAVENAKSARAFLGALGMPCAMRELRMQEIAGDAAALLAPLRAGRPLGVLSEAGCPAVADPGAALVAAAHAEGFRVIPLVGPSAVLLALMASGLQGQRFAFCGYLPREKRARADRIRALERRSRAENETQIFIETPYRNEALLSALFQHCRGDTLLCIAADLTLPGGFVAAQTIAEWKKKPPTIDRRPAVFLLSRAPT